MSGLDWQVLDVRFTQGLETQTNPKLIPAGKWRQLLNCTLSGDNTPTRRDGITALVSSANGNGLALHNDELLHVNGATLSSVALGTTNHQAASLSACLGTLPTFNLAVSEVFRNGSQSVVDSMDCASSGDGMTCYVWRERSISTLLPLGVRYFVMDESTGARLSVSGGTSVANDAAAIMPRVVWDPATRAFFILWISGGNNLVCSVVQEATPATVGVGTIVAGPAAVVRCLDACAFNGAVHAVYGWNDGITSVRAVELTQTAGVPSVAFGPFNMITNAHQAIGGLGGVAAAASGSIAVACSWGSAGKRANNLNTGYASVGDTLLSGATTCAGFAHACAIANGGTFELYTDHQDQIAVDGVFNVEQLIFNATTLATLSSSIVVTGAGYSGGVGLAAGPTGPWIAGKPFIAGAGRVVLPVGTIENWNYPAPSTIVNLNAQNTLYFYDCTQAVTSVGALVGHALTGTWGTPTIAAAAGAVASPCSVPIVDASGNLAMAVPQRYLALSFGVDFSSSGVARVSLSSSTGASPSRAQLGQSTYLAGPAMMAYSGGGLVVEHGFHVFPEGIFVTITAAGGPVVTQGTHQVVAVYEWVDPSGQRHQSAPSPAVTFTAAAANDNLAISVPNFFVTQKTGVQLVLYMTQASGLTFYRLPLSYTAGVLSHPAPNSTAANATVITFAFGVSGPCDDASIALNEALYSQPSLAGTTLPNIAPPPCTALGVHQGRLFCDAADAPGRWAYSQQVTFTAVGPVGLQFSDVLGGTVDSDANAIAGFVSLDEKLVIACAAGFRVVYGQAPTPGGLNGTYSDAQKVPSDVGCSTGRSLLLMPPGIFFKSAKGWYLFGRDQVVRYIGSGVEAYNANDVTAAVLLADRREARFTSSSGYTLVYSYQSEQWSVFAQTNALMPTLDAVWWETRNAFVQVSSSQGLSYDDATAQSDTPGGLGPLAIQTVSQTAWLKLSSLDGFQRVRRAYLTGKLNSLGSLPSDTMNIQVDYDDADNQTATGSYNFTVIFAAIIFPAGGPIDVRHRLARQKCKSVCFTFTESNTNGKQPLGGLQALSLEVGLKKGVNKLQASQTVG